MGELRVKRGKNSIFALKILEKPREKSGKEEN
jgi:hypothetical protein